MTTNIANHTTAATPSNNNFSTTLFVALIGIASLVGLAIMNPTLGIALLASAVAVGGYKAIQSFRDMNFDFDLGESVMPEIVAELNQRND